MRDQARSRRGTTMVEVLLATIILSFVAQVLFCGYKYVAEQPSFLLSQQANLRNEANNCMEYLLRSLDQTNFDWTNSVTEAGQPPQMQEALLQCQERCRQLNDHYRFDILLHTDQTQQLFNYGHLLGTWIEVRVTNPQSGGSYSAQTLIGYADPKIKVNASVRRNYPKNAPEMHCYLMDSLLKQDYIPFTFEQWEYLKRVCDRRRNFILEVSSLNIIDSFIRNFGHTAESLKYGAKHQYHRFSRSAEPGQYKPVQFADGTVLRSCDDYRTKSKEWDKTNRWQHVMDRFFRMYHESQARWKNKQD